MPSSATIGFAIHTIQTCVEIRTRRLRTLTFAIRVHRRSEQPSRSKRALPSLGVIARVRRGIVVHFRSQPGHIEGHFSHLQHRRRSYHEVTNTDQAAPLLDSRNRPTAVMGTTLWQSHFTRVRAVSQDYAKLRGLSTAISIDCPRLRVVDRAHCDVATQEMLSGALPGMIEYINLSKTKNSQR